MSDHRQAGSNPIAGGRALTVCSQPLHGRRDERAGAEFLAQLIACQRRLPDYRSTRNAEPQAAALAYRARLASRSAGLNCSI